MSAEIHSITPQPPLTPLGVFVAMNDLVLPLGDVENLLALTAAYIERAANFNSDPDCRRISSVIDYIWAKVEKMLDDHTRSTNEVGLRLGATTMPTERDPRAAAKLAVTLALNCARDRDAKLALIGDMTAWLHGEADRLGHNIE